MTEATVVGLRLCVGSRDPMKIVDDATVITGEGIAASARASLGIYNSKDDIDALSSAIKKCNKVFNN